MFEFQYGVFNTHVTRTVVVIKLRVTLCQGQFFFI